MSRLSKIAQLIEKERVGRVEAKEELDKTISLATDTNDDVMALTLDNPPKEEGYMTLLSEGAVLHANETIRLYIAKGTIEKFYNGIGDDYEGYITTGHRSLNAFPVREGYFRKEDLKLSVDDNGRTELLVKPHVNTKLSNVRDIILQNEPFSISSEFQFTNKEIKDDEMNDMATLTAYDLSKGGSGEFPITDTIHITGFSLVGSPGNAKSGGYDPSILLPKKGEEKLSKSKNSILDSLFASLSGKEEKEQLASDKTPETKEVGEKDEETTETVEEPTETVEEAKDTEESLEDNATKEALAKAVAVIEGMSEQMEKLKAQNEQLIAKLQEKQIKEAKLSQETDEHLTKLNNLLDKFGVNIETPKQEKLSHEDSTNIFGRQSIWED